MISFRVQNTILGYICVNFSQQQRKLKARFDGKRLRNYRVHALGYEHTIHQSMGYLVVT